jgi:hypothetical protein
MKPTIILKPLVILISVLIMTLGLPAWAVDLDRDAAASVAQRASGGRVLAVESVRHDGRAVWRVKVVTPQGEVRVVLVDAATGRTL